MIEKIKPTWSAFRGAILQLEGEKHKDNCIATNWYGWLGEEWVNLSILFFIQKMGANLHVFNHKGETIMRKELIEVK